MMKERHKFPRGGVRGVMSFYPIQELKISFRGNFTISFSAELFFSDNRARALAE